MEILPVDPRDTEWETGSPVYRIYFWRLQASGGYESEEFELRGAADVHEAAAWGEAQAAGRTFVLYAVLDISGERGLVRLAGIDPLDTSQAT